MRITMNFSNLTPTIKTKSVKTVMTNKLKSDMLPRPQSYRPNTKKHSKRVNYVNQRNIN